MTGRIQSGPADGPERSQWGMANIQPRRNKNGTIVSYSIRVYKGRDPNTGKQLTPYSTTWRPPAGWSEKRIRKEAERQAVHFEKKCREGRIFDGRVTFGEYAEYVMRLKEQSGVKHLTLLHYRQNLDRILPSLGRLKLTYIRPQHLNLLYEELSKPGGRKNSDRAVARPELKEVLQNRDLGHRLRDRYGRELRFDTALQGKHVSLVTAQRMADTLNLPLETLFRIERDLTPLCSRTIRNCHLLASGILGQAEREMLIPYNPASRATPPRVTPSSPNYYQLEVVEQILSALNREPIKWRALIQLLLVTGCRRGEILGLKWDKVDSLNRQITIDCTLLYASDRGVYEGTPKTKGSIRSIKLPEQTVELLESYRCWQEQQKRRLGAEWTPSPFVFTGEKGGPMNPSQLGNWLDRFARRHNLPHLNPHAFRHTMTSVLFFNGVDSVSISRRLGHASVSTTTNLYSHVMEQAENRISDCVADVLLTSQKKRRKKTNS